MAEAPEHDKWLKQPWKDTGAPDDFSRRKSGSGNHYGTLGLIPFGFAAVAYWLSSISAKKEAERSERYAFKRKQEELWRQHEERASARGRGQFDNMERNSEGFWEQSPQQRVPGIPSARPLDRTEMNLWQQSRFDAAQDIRYTLESEAQWKADPKGMAENARYRAEALGEPLDPRAARYFAERGLPAPVAPASGGAVATRPPVSAGPSVNPHAVEAGLGVDLENMKRVFPPRSRLAGVGRGAGRALPWIGAALAGYGIYSGMKDRGGVSWSNAPGAVGDEALNQVKGAASGVLGAGGGVGYQIADWLSGKSGAPSWMFGDLKLQRWAINQGEKNIRSVVGWIFGGKKSSSVPAAPSAPDPDAGLTEEEIRAKFSENPPDERAPANVGGVPIGYVPMINPNAGQYRNAGGWGESAPKPKRGKPFADPYHIGQARLQAEHEIEEQNEADRRKQREEDQNQRKADNYIKFIETQDRKQARAQAASARRELENERASDWLAQLAQWERERLERPRRRHRSINVNEWQAAGATVGGFAQINVELVRSEIERSLERGDAAIRMN